MQPNRSYRSLLRVVVTVALLLPWLRASAVGEDVVEARFGNGMRVLLVENHKLPTVVISVMFKGAGGYADPAGKAGLAAMTAALLREGTRTRSAKDIADQVDFLGASLGASADWDRATVNASALSRDTATILELMADITLRPAFKAEEVERRRSQVLGAITQSLDDADGLAVKAFQRFLLGTHPYGFPLIGLHKTVSSITRDDIAAFHAANYRADNAVLVVAGDFKPDTLLPMLEKALGTFRPGTVPAPPPAPEPVPRKARILLLDKPDLTQAKITFGHLGIPREHPDYYAAVVMNTILGGGGFLSRLSNVVRSKLGLTYNIRSGFDARKLGGTWSITSFTRTETAVDAIKAAMAEIDRLQQGGVTSKELSEIQGYLVGSFALGMETPEARAGLLLSADLYNLGLDYIRTYPTKIRAVTAQDVARAAQSLLNVGILRFVVVGNASKLEAALSTLGTVETRPHTEWDEI
ncbi:MAG: pitrilysin family protein [Myxococcota bacterium]